MALTTRTAAANLDPVEPEELRFHFHAGNLALDLVATIGERWRRNIERLRRPEDLARWLVEAQLLSDPPAVELDHLVAARRLRNAILELVQARRSGRTLPHDALTVLNEHAARPDLAPQLDAGGHRQVTHTTLANALATVAREAVDLLASVPPDRLRECAADDCALLFVDTSRPGRRRWCSMATCGNRRKNAAYRERHDGATP